MENLVIIHGRICTCTIHEINSCVKKDSHQNNSHTFYVWNDRWTVAYRDRNHVTLQFLNLEECRVRRLFYRSQIHGDPSYSVNYWKICMLLGFKFKDLWKRESTRLFCAQFQSTASLRKFLCTKCERQWFAAMFEALNFPLILIRCSQDVLKSFQSWNY